MQRMQQVQVAFRFQVKGRVSEWAQTSLVDYRFLGKAPVVQQHKWVVSRLRIRGQVALVNHRWAWRREGQVTTFPLMSVANKRCLARMARPYQWMSSTR